MEADLTRFSVPVSVVSAASGPCFQDNNTDSVKIYFRLRYNLHTVKLTLFEYSSASFGNT